MNRPSLISTILLLAAALMACSSANSEAPSAGQVHVSRYLASHATDALADLNRCKSCHGGDLAGGPHVAGCLSCHPDGEPITLHDMPFTDAADHGAAARNGQRRCFACHGTTPDRFDGGILADPDLYGLASANCSAAGCHPATGAHPTRWQGENDITEGYQASHRSVTRTAIDDSCAMCHQVTYQGRQPRNDAPSCFSSSFTNADGSTTACHPGGPVTAHPLPYTDPLDHGAAAREDLSSCVPCHASPADAGAGENPRFNVSVGDLENGCEDCHAADTAHPTPQWTGPGGGGHAGAGQMDTACALCHGTGLDGPEGGGVGPACTDCHSAGSPLTLTGCTSCHNQPPDGLAPAGGQYPNREGAHGVHDALAGVGGNCSVCHQGAGSGTAAHFNGGGAATVSLSATYNAQSGSAGYDGNSDVCASTRCHGGQPTPNWWSGSLTVDIACEACHTTSTGQYNSATSGLHRYHVVSRHLDCTDCHSASLLAPGHFSNLATTAFESNPWDTLKSSLGYSHSTGRGCSVSGCHGAHYWTGGD
ncbi:MAG: hypothetical protein P8X55_05320 [Desulfosarcinaceae bacterium]